MEKLKNSTEKLCGFYVSDWHLVTMILPYINKELNEKANVITILQNNIESNIKTLISKLNLQNESKILNIDWKNSKGAKYGQVEDKLKNTINENNYTNIILVSGTNDYINFVNNNIDKYVLKNKEKMRNIKLKIINCYEVTEFNNGIKEILDKHDKVLNTSGEKDIAEVFEGYTREKGVC